MKRVVEITTILISIDQIFKSYFQFFFPNHKIEWNGWGVTYKKNYGTWLIPNATEYYGSNVPLFRRNGYRQSGVMIP